MSHFFGFIDCTIQEAYKKDNKTRFKQIIKGEFVFENDSDKIPKIEDAEKVYMERLEEIGGKSDSTEEGRYAPIDDLLTYGRIKED